MRRACIITRWPSLLRAAVFLFFLLLTAAPPLFCSEPDDDPMIGYGYRSCNISAPACTAYLTFLPEPPLYTSPVSVSFLLNASASAVATANNITFAELPVPNNNHKLLVPVPCSCSSYTGGGYYQHTTTYILRFGSTLYNIGTVVFQSLSSYHAIEYLNYPNFDPSHPVFPNADSIIIVPLICACPSAQQAAAGVRYMVTYYADEHEDEHAVAHRFGIDLDALRGANPLYSFTDPKLLLVPLKNPPTPDMLAVPDPPAPVVVPPASHCRPWSRRRWIVDVGVGSGCGLVVSAGIVTLHILCHRRRRGRGLDVLGNNKETPPLVAAVRDAVDSLVVYTYPELVRATAGFADKCRVAGSSAVFRAVIDGQAFAVKHVAADDVHRRGDNIVGLLARVNHSCLVRLSGLCVHRGDTYLVLEFAENGALSHWLHGVNGNGNDDDATCRFLSWKQRVQVACDVASGLNYLHHFTNPPYVHKNLSSSNVLLDAKFRAKVSNFGLARSMATATTRSGGSVQATRHVVGTHGYLAPEYLENGLISTHLDVFAFGVILLELLSGKEAAFVAADGHASLLWEAAVEGRIADGGGDAWFRIKEFMDPRLRDHYPFGLAFTVAVLALRCLAPEPRARPSMSEVLALLSAVHDTTMEWDPQNYGVSESMVVGR